MEILLRESLFGRLLNRTPNRVPQTATGPVGHDDAEMPINWPALTKAFVTTDVMLLNFSFYASSALFTPSIPLIQAKFAATTSQGTLCLSLFFIAYGIGPLVLSPLSNVPSIGRTLVYFLGSPAFCLINAPYAIALYAVSGICGPILGPLSCTDPVILSVNIHIMLIYGLLYLWFEFFPFGTFGEIHHFTALQRAIAFFGILTGAVISVVAYIMWLYLSHNPRLVNLETSVTPEDRLRPGQVGAICIPICHFIFAWSTRTSVHWIAPIIGTAFFAPGFYLTFQSILNYLAEAYLSHATTVLGVISIALVPLPFILERSGKRLRTWSKYAK
ncbi:hypothetical protein HRG_015124 [Hirsutella rhossiliensis]